MSGQQPAEHDHSGPCPVPWCSHGHPCRVCADPLTPEHVHPELAPHGGEDGY